MPTNPEDFQLRTDSVERCVRMLDQWDACDPWSLHAKAQGEQILTLACQVCAPLVPQLESADKTAKFLSAVVTTTATGRAE